MSFNTLRQGDSGDAVATWQRVLNADPSMPPPAIIEDGIFGAKTTSRTRLWQANRGLVPDGVVGSISWSRAAEELTGKLPDFPVSPSSVKSEPVWVGARMVDSYPFSIGGTPAQAKALRDTDVDGLFGYLGVISRERLESLLDNHLGFCGVTLANRFDGKAAVTQAKALGLAPGTSLCLDIEGKAIYDMGAALIQPCSEWRKAVKDAGFRTQLYVGSPQPLTSAELEALAFDGYWNALSRETDRFNKLAEPARGWNTWQMIPQHMWKNTGVFVDVNMVGQDFREGVPYWTIRA